MQCFFHITYFPVKSIVLVTNCIFSLGLLHYVFLLYYCCYHRRGSYPRNLLYLGVFIFSFFFSFFFICFFFKYPNENMATACNKNQSYYAFGGFFLTDHHITIYRAINLPNQIQSKKEKHSYCWGLGNAVCDLPSQYVNRVTICFHQIS